MTYELEKTAFGYQISRPYYVDGCKHRFARCYLTGRKGSYRWLTDHSQATFYALKTARRLLSDLREGRLTI